MTISIILQAEKAKKKKRSLLYSSHSHAIFVLIFVKKRNKLGTRTNQKPAAHTFRLYNRSLTLT
jgi:hypothetical protein